MSIVDLLFNVGPQSKEIILKGGVISEKNIASLAVTDANSLSLEQLDLLNV
jgi:hypothetical protein